MSDTATILDTYIAFRAKLLALLGDEYVPDIDDCRGRRWGIVKQERRGKTRDILYVAYQDGFVRNAYMNGHVTKDIGGGITAMREEKPHHNVTVYLLTTELRDDEAAAKKDAP